MATDNLNGSNSSTSGNSDSVLKDSPWGRLSEVTSLDNVAAGFASATGNQSGGATGAAGAAGAAGANSSSSDSPYGGNPFANFGNPNASGNVFTGGTNPWASLNNSGSSSSSGSNPFGGDNTGSSPVSGGSSSGSNPFGGDNTGSSPISGGSSSGSNPFGGDNTGSSPISGGSSSGSNPFGGDNTGSSPISGGSSSGSNPFGGDNTGSSPISGGSSSGSNPFGGDNTGSSSAGGFGGSSTSTGSGNFGGIDFGSASQSVSFQDRVQTDQLVDSKLSENGVSTPTSVFSGGGSSNPFDPGFNPSSSGSNSSSPVIASPTDAGNSGGGSSVVASTTSIANSGGGSSVGGSNSGGGNPFGGGNNSDGVAQVSPFDQLQQNLNDYFQPFSNGGTPDASQFGDPSKINPFNANLGGSSSSANSNISTDDTRNSVLSSIDTTNTDTLGSQVEDKVVSLTNSSNGTQTVGGNAPIAVDNTPSGNDSVFPQLASNDGSNLAPTSPIADTSSQSSDGSSTNAGNTNPSLDDFNKFLSAAQSGDDSLIGSSIPDGTPSFVADAIQANSSTIANTIGQNQNQGSNFTGGGSNDGNSIFTGGSQNTQGYSDQVAYYQGLTSQFQQNPQDAAQTLLGDNQSSGSSNPFGGGASNPFGGGGSPFGA